MMKYSVAILMSAMSLAFSVFSAPSNPSLFIDVKGYKIGDAVDWQDFSTLPGLSIVAPAKGEGLVYSNVTYAAKNINVYTVTIPFGYRVGKWLKAYDDPFVFTDGEAVEGSEGALTVTIPWDGRCRSRIYLGLVLEYDDNRTFTLGKSPFGAGTVGTNLGTYACLKGDVFQLAAIPSHDDETGLDRAVFRRWSDGVTDARRTVVIDTNLTLVAEFVPLSWQVDFDANGGAVTPTGKKVTCDAAYGWMPTPVCSGHSFAGWYSEPLNGSRVGFDTTVGAIGDHRLYAHWEAASCVIGFELLGEGNGTVEGVGRFPYGTATMLEAKPYEGSVFVGWEDGETRNPRRIDVTGDRTYGARFEVATYDVTFTYRNAEGEWIVSPVQTVQHGKPAVPPDASEYDSWPEHHFRTWSTEDYKAVTRSLAGQQSVQAIYDAQTYKVTFVYCDRDGNAVTTMPQHVEAGKAAVPPGESVANNWIGHKLVGWQPDYSVIRADLTVEAVYEFATYDVTFTYRDADGKDVTLVENVAFGAEVPFDLADSHRNDWVGHTFKYWSLNMREVVPPIVVSNDLHLTAAYEGYARIRYFANGGEGEMGDETYVMTPGEGGRQVKLAPNAFAKPGYEFSGWSMGSERFVDEDVVVIKDGTVYDLSAVWLPVEYWVAFDGNGGTIENAHTERVTYGAEFRRTFDGTDIIEKPEGYEFCGFSTNGLSRSPEYKWADGFVEIVASNLTTAAGSTVTFYAIWSKPPQTVTVVIGDQTSTFEKPVDDEIAEGELDKFKPDRTGYTFDCWMANGVQAVFPVKVPKGGLTLTAKLSPITYEVKFLAPDATSGEMTNQSFTYDEAQCLTSNVFERTGYAFAHWLGPDGRQYADGALVSNLTTKAEIVTLQAAWKNESETNDLSKALGTNLKVTSPENAWTVVPGGTNGVVRTSKDPEGTLRIEIPKAGKFICYFNCGGDGDNGLHWKYYPVDDAEFDGETYKENKTIVLEPQSAGTLEFSGSPSSGFTWTLSNVSFE